MTHPLFTTMALITITWKQPGDCGGQTTSRVILHTLCHDRSILKCDHMRTRHAETACPLGVNVEKQTVAFLSLAEIVVIQWMNYHPLHAPAPL